MSAERIAHSILAREDAHQHHPRDQVTERPSPDVVMLAQAYLNLLDQHEAWMAWGVRNGVKPGLDR